MTQSSFDRAAYARRLHLVVGLVTVAAVVMAALPIFDQLGRSVAECEGVLENQCQMLTQEAAVSLRLRTLTDEIRSRQQERSQLRNRLPDSVGERALVERVAVTCERHQLNVREFQPPIIQTCGDLVCTRLTLRVECDWASLCSFLADCKQSHTIVSVEQLTIESRETDGRTLLVSLSLADWSAVPHRLTLKQEGSVQ